jgi:hypothetical protein
MRRLAGIEPGDKVRFSFEEGRIVIEKPRPIDDAWNAGQSAMPGEWDDPAMDAYDDPAMDAYNDLRPLGDRPGPVPLHRPRRTPQTPAHATRFNLKDLPWSGLPTRPMRRRAGDGHDRDPPLDERYLASSGGTILFPTQHRFVPRDNASAWSAKR